MTSRKFFEKPEVLIAIVVLILVVGHALLNPTRPEIEDRHGVMYFHDVPCTDDCSGHVAGYLWAKKQDLEDADKCDNGIGSSISFVEGCRIYAAEALVSIGEDEEIEEGRRKQDEQQ